MEEQQLEMGEMTTEWLKILMHVQEGHLLQQILEIHEK